MKYIKFRKGVVIGIIVLFFSIAIQPVIIADDSIESEYSEMVDITIQICRGNGGYDHNVMLSQEQAEKLENLLNITETKLDAAKTMEETSAIFNDTVVSLNELGVLPEDMSIEDAQRLVNGMQQNPRIVNILEKWYGRNQGDLDDYDNFLCLIAGHTDRTFFIGPSLIPIIILALIISPPLVLLNNLLIKLFDIAYLYAISLALFLAFGGLNFGIWQYIPLAIGHTIVLGFPNMGTPPFPIPAEGWIYTIGLKGIKNWDNIYGMALGFTGVKIIIKPPLSSHFYLGAALMVNDK